MNGQWKGAMIAAAVAGLFVAGETLTASPAGAAEEEKVKCAGVNECKGKGACGGATHDCAGKNECKGKGWVHVTEQECKDKGGTVVK